MSRSQVIVLHVANILVAGTGLVYGVMRYFMEPTEEWAVVNHPWQPHLQHLHVLIAPTLVFAVGLIWTGHVVAKYGNGMRNRRNGLGLAVLFVPMTASGYLVQIAVDPAWRSVWVWVHGGTSILWVVVFAVHVALAVVRRRASQSSTPASAVFMMESQLSEPSAASFPVSGGVRHRRDSSSSGTSLPNRADSTSAAVGGSAE